MTAHSGGPIRVLELRSVRGTGGGPEKTILLGAARADPARVAVTVCYIRDARDDVFTIDARARELGVDYVEVIERHSFDRGIWTQLRRLIRERGIHIVHAHEHKTDLLALLLSRAEQIVPLSTAHGWSGTSLTERGYYFVDRRLLRYYPLVVAVSEPIRQTLIACGARPERVRKILNGIDHRAYTRNPLAGPRIRQQLGLAPDTPVIGAVGRLEPIKRFDLLIEATARLAPPTTLVIAGEGSARPELEALASRLGIADRLMLLGHRDDAFDVHHAFDVYVQTSDSEGIPNAILEAMALGTPVVATNVGGTSELITDREQGLLVARRNVDQLVAAVQETLADGDATATRVAAARTRVERSLSFDRRQAALEAVYEELAGQRAGRVQEARHAV